MATTFVHPGFGLPFITVNVMVVFVCTFCEKRRTVRDVSEIEWAAEEEPVCDLFCYLYRQIDTHRVVLFPAHPGLQ